jgi:hypothetical protein
MERKSEAKKTVWQMVKFAFVGVLNTLVDFAVFQALNLLLGWVYAAQVIAIPAESSTATYGTATGRFASSARALFAKSCCSFL